jgi:hypothetical protein
MFYMPRGKFITEILANDTCHGMSMGLIIGPLA